MMKKLPKQQRKLQAIPLYKRIEQDIRVKVKEAYWPTDQPLPSRLKLAEEYGVALPTIERAIDLLIEDGTLRAESGRGTFVAKPGLMEAVAAGTATNDAAQRFLQGQVDEKSATAPQRSQTLLGIVSADFPLDRPPNPHPLRWDDVVINSLERTFSKLGGGTYYGLRYHNGTQLLPSIETAIRELLAHGVAAIVIAQIVNVQRVTDVILSLLDPEQIPVVLLSWENIASPLPYVVYDHRCAGYRAAQHLVQAGYSRLIYLDLLDYWWSKERLRGAQSALREAGLPSETLLIYRTAMLPDPLPPHPADGAGDDERAGYAAGKSLLARQVLPDLAVDDAHAPIGVIAPTDIIACGFLRAIVEAGLIPGADIGLVGFDDRPEASRLGLTSLRPPLEAIGEAAAHLLVDRLNGKTTESHVKLCSDLIVRASTCRPTGDQARNRTSTWYQHRKREILDLTGPID